MFSHRLPDDLTPNALAGARARIGEAPFDLSASNPTTCGIDYPPGLLDGLSDAAAMTYRPDPRGAEGARRAVAGEYRRQGLVVDPGRIVLTASTSEAYGLLFKLLCDPGDEVLAPVPSYPLIPGLARFEGVHVRGYRLHADRDWQPGPIDPGPSTRAVVVVHPNNPTGSWIGDDDRRRLVDVCAARGCGLIIDEVFLDYPLSPTSVGVSFAGESGAPCFSLGGLSKSVGLPQLKLAWIVVGGPENLAGAALERLEHLADGYLSVNTPVQVALPRILEVGAVVRGRILERCRANLSTLRRIVADSPLSVLTPQAGWTAVLRFPRVLTDEALALRLLERRGVAVQPGYFFDFPTDGHLAIGLLPPPEVFAEGVRRIVEEVVDVR